MGHQHRYVHITQDVARDAAEDYFTQPRMAVCAHHQEVGIQLGYLG